MKGSTPPSPTPVHTLLNVALVSRVKRNPYVALLCKGLCQAHLGLRPHLVDQFSLGWMWQHRRDVHVLHLHWLELFFLYPGLWRSLKRWVSVVLGLIVARLSRVCIVYTVHNLEQHEGRRPHLVHWGTRLILWLAHAVHVHDADTARQLARRWGRRRNVLVIPHGNYVGAYANEVSPLEARRRLGLPAGAYIYLSLGRVRPYKGLETLMRVFGRLDDPDILLLIAGEVQEPDYARRLMALAGEDARIRLHLHFVPDDELQLYLNACDVSVLPYEHVTTSGAAILSFSFGRPIVAPAIGCFPELVGAQERGMLYATVSADGSRPLLVEGRETAVCPDLAIALQQVRLADQRAMRRACVQYALALDWLLIAERHAAMYRQCLRMNP
ncbi:MAG: glycosyltransferase [Chloroflexi bacterium]|nr:glycosyltransferase [Chloroflexota bacterium]